MKNSILIKLVFIFTCSLLQFQSISSCGFGDNKLQEKDELFKPVIDTLLKRGVDSSFIFKLLLLNNTQFDDKYVKMNVTGYLKKSKKSKHKNYSKSVLKSKSFLKDNLELLQEAEKKYGVSKEVIVSILWTETRLGTYLGKNHIPSVFFSTALVNLDKYRNLNIAELDKLNLDKAEYNKLVQKIYDRSQKKSDWAIDELVAMYEIDKKNMLNFDTLYGSWAGAFGMSQFLPSSYYKYAVDGNNDGTIDLFNKEDAIASIANYLQSYGWQENNKKMQRKAIFAYNHSKSYVNSVLNLAKKLK